MIQQKHVQDDLAAVAIKQPRTHRQYMNRCFAARRLLALSAMLTIHALLVRASQEGWIQQVRYVFSSLLSCLS